MNLTRFSRSLLLVCAFLFALCSSSHFVHASENDTIRQNFVPSEFDMSMLDDETFNYSTSDESAFASYSSAYRSTGSTSWNWHNYYLTPLTLNSGNYQFNMQFNLNEYMHGGKADLTVRLVYVYDGSSLNLNINTIRLNLENKNQENICNAKSYSFSQSSSESSTGNAVFYITFKDLDITDYVRKIQILFEDVTFNATKTIQFIPTYFEFTFKDESSSQLGSIIEYIKELPSNIGKSLTSLFDNVVNAVQNLGNFIIDGIKNLFVPSEEDLTDYFDRWKELLSSRFGALYEVFDIIVGYYERFASTSARSVVEFPVVVVPLGAVDFTFGGWSVNLVPNGFDIVFDALRLLISFIATISFINSMRRRYDKVVEK